LRSETCFEEAAPSITGQCGIEFTTLSEAQEFDEGTTDRTDEGAAFAFELVGAWKSDEERGCAAEKLIMQQRKVRVQKNPN
jgi:hypothetical protein